MANFLLPFVLTILLGCSVLAQEVESGAVSNVREPRGILARRRCRKYGICEGGHGGFHGGGYGGGYQGGYGGYPQGYGGYPGYGGIPPINIGISQSQSSANAGGGGYSNGYYPYNYQQNNGFGGGYGGRPHGPDYFGNGQGSYNSQFNGNYYGPGRPGGLGGFGFQGPYGNGFYGDEAHGSSENRPEYDDNGLNSPQPEQGSQNDYSQGHDQGNYAASGSFAYAGRSNQ